MTMTNVEKRLAELGYSLPAAPKAFGSYVPAVKSGTLVFTSGQLPAAEGMVRFTGKVGGQVNLEQAAEAAKLCLVNALAAIRHEIGDFDKVKRIVKLTGYVNSADAFTDQPKVLNAASDMLVGIFGEKGRHARSAVGVKELPKDAPVELELVVEIEAS